MGNFLPSTETQRNEMLNTIGVSSAGELYADIPQAMREKAAEAVAAMPEGVSEFEALDQMKQLAKQNRVFDAIFRGAGAYWHHIPAVVLTAYIAAFTANALHSEPVYDSLRARCLDLARAASRNDNNGNDPDASANAAQLQK